jgi:hypothetical protein
MVGEHRSPQLHFASHTTVSIFHVHPSIKLRSSLYLTEVPGLLSVRSCEWRSYCRSLRRTRMLFRLYIAYRFVKCLCEQNTLVAAVVKVIGLAL